MTTQPDTSPPPSITSNDNIKKEELDEEEQMQDENDASTSENPQKSQQQPTTTTTTTITNVKQESNSPTNHTNNTTAPTPADLPKKITTLKYVIRKLVKEAPADEVVSLREVEEKEDLTSLPMPHQDTSLPKNHTIYMNHLNEKLPLSQLKLLLQSLCERFGTVLDICVHDSLKRKGQAWVVFDTVESATEAVNNLHGIIIDGKRIGVQYAKSKSDAIAKKDGTYEMQKRKRETERKLNAGLDQMRESKRRRSAQKKLAASATATTAAEEAVVPHNILLIQDLADDATQQDLEEMFSNFPGYQQVRFIAAKHVAFVDFDSEQNATLALDMDGMQVKNKAIRVTYSKK